MPKKKKTQLAKWVRDYSHFIKDEKQIGQQEQKVRPNRMIHQENAIKNHNEIV